MFPPIETYKDSAIGHCYILDYLCTHGSGWGAEGFQGGLLVINRNVVGGGIGGKNLPCYHSYVLPKDLDISSWYHLCFSYWSKLNHLHLYVDKGWIGKDWIVKD